MHHSFAYRRNLCNAFENDYQRFVYPEDAKLRMILPPNATNWGLGEAIGLQKNDVYNLTGTVAITYYYDLISNFLPFLFWLFLQN